MNKILDLIRDAANGYEPVLVRSIAVAVFTLLAAFGIGTGDLPPQADAVLVFLAFIAPIIAGLLTRAKVVPTKKLDE